MKIDVDIEAYTAYCLSLQNHDTIWYDTKTN